MEKEGSSGFDEKGIYSSISKSGKAIIMNTRAKEIIEKELTEKTGTLI